MQPRHALLLALAAPPGAALALSVASVDCTRSGVDASPAPESSTDGGAEGPCRALFGNPNAQTGLSADECRPECTCGATVFLPPTYGAAFVQSLVDDWQLATPYPPLTSDPYADASTVPADPDGTVCAVLPKGGAGPRPRLYDLVTYPSMQAAGDAGASVTHFGRCGVCSTLANLAVYMRENDLTAPVRTCGLTANGDGGGNGDVGCLQQLGFDLPCAQAWAYDTDNTRRACLGVCLSALGQPYNLEGGALNPCLQCDEEQSGPVFQRVAGRTRRNSGLPNAICRPCSEVRALVHSY